VFCVCSCSADGGWRTEQNVLCVCVCVFHNVCVLQLVCLVHAALRVREPLNVFARLYVKKKESGSEMRSFCFGREIEVPLT